MAPTRAAIVAAILCLLAVAAAGCGGDTADDATMTPSAPPASTAVGGPAIEERVVRSLAGLLPAGPVQVARTPGEFLAIVGSDDPADAPALREGGFVEGAVQLFVVPEPEDSALSAAFRLASPAAASAEVALLAASFAEDLPPGAVEGDVPGVPGSRTIVLKGGADGSPAFVSAIAADGPFVHVQVGGGSMDDAQLQSVVDAAGALHESLAAAGP